MRDKAAGAAGAATRIFTACHGTQLLVIQHFRRHLGRAPAREFLLWHPIEHNPLVERFMSTVIEGAGFSGVLDMRGFESLQQRSQGATAWWFESARRCRQDANALRSWLEANEIRGEEVELWTDDPIHFNVIFAKAYFRDAVHVKIPHAFNLEDSACRDYREGLWRKSLAVGPAKRFLFWPWLRLVSGCDFRPKNLFFYNIGYSFDQPSCWAADSVNVADLISVEAFRETFASLPTGVRAELELEIASSTGSPGPRLLLLLFGLDPALTKAYQKSLTRIFSGRSEEFKAGVLAVKVHPGARGIEEEPFIDWAASNLPIKVVPIRSLVNLEFMLRELVPDFVLAGPCGALPIVQRLGIGIPIVLPEVMEELCRAFPADGESYRALARGMGIW